MTQRETKLTKSAFPMADSAEAAKRSEESCPVDDPVTETLKQTFPASGPPSWWAWRLPPAGGTQPARSRR